jgi:uncharacterized membrane protein YfcA
MADLINGAFELWGAVFILLNIIQLLRDKQVKGIHWGSSFFFTSWGLWNCWYYPYLGQWASFWGGAVMCLLNFIWLGMRLWYSRRPCVVCRHCEAPVSRKWACFD